MLTTDKTVFEKSLPIKEAQIDPDLAEKYLLLQEENNRLKQTLEEYTSASEAVAADSLLQMNMILDNTGEAFIVLNTDLNIIFFNKTAFEKSLKLTGTRYIKGESILKGVKPERLADLKSLYASVLKGNKANYKYEFKEQDGSYYFDLSYNPIVNDIGQVYAIMIIARDITEQEFALKELSLADYKFRSLVQGGGDMVAILNENAEYVYVSPNSTTITGIKAEDFIGRSAFEFINEEDAPGLLSILKRIKTEKQIKIPPFRFRNSVNEWRWVETIVTNKFDDPAINGIIANSRDVTEMINLVQQVEKNQQYYQSLFIHNPDVVYSLDLTGKFVSVNQAMVRISGRTEQELIGSSFIPFIHPDDIEEVKMHYGMTMKGIPQNYKARILITGKPMMYVNITSMPVIIDGEISGIYGIAKDITEQTTISCTLGKAVSELNKIMDTSPDVICTIGNDLNFMRVSAAAETLWGYAPEELTGRRYTDIVFKDDIVKTVSTSLLVQAGADTTSFENRLVRKDGSLIPMIWSSTWDVSEKIMYCIGRDAREQHSVNEALEKERERYTALFMNAPAFICTFKGPDHIYQMVNPGYMKLSGKTDLIGKPVKEAVPELESQGIIKLLDEVYETGVTYTSTEQKVQIVRKSSGLSEERFINYLMQVYRNASGEIEGIFVFGIDVTDQVNARQEIVESEKRQRGLFLHNPMPMWLFELSSKKFMDVNNAAIDHYGYSREEFLSMTIKDIRPEEDNEKLKNIPKIEKAGIATHKGLWRHIKKNGDLINVEITSHIINYDNRKATLVLANDITEKIKAEEQREFEKSNKEALINSTQDLVWSVDKNLKLITANKSFIRRIKTSTGRTLKRGDDVLMPHYEQSFILNWKAYYLKALSGESFIKDIFTAVSKSWSEVSFSPICNGETILGVACFSRDITEAKKTHDQLLALNNKLETAQQIAKLGYWGHDLKTNEFYCSKEVFNIFELNEKGHIPFNDFYDMVHEDDKMSYEKAIGLSKSRGTSHDIEFRILLPDARVKWIRQIGNIKELNVRPGCLEGTIQDITDKKEEEQQLRLMESVVTNATDMVMITCENPGSPGLPVIMYVNETFSKLTGYSAQEIIGHSPDILHGPLTDQHEVNKIADSYVNNKSVQIEIINYKKNGEPYWVQVAMVPVSNNGVITHWIAIERDITERKKQEEEQKSKNLIRQRETLQTIINTQEKERYHFGQELHDNIQQILAGCKIYIGMALEADKGNTLLEQSKKHLTDAITETRNLSHRLAPASFKYKSLISALRSLMDDFEKMFSFSVSFDAIKFDPSELGDEVQLTIYRIMQGQLNNIAKHAAAKNVTVLLTGNENAVSFSIKDDGKGFDLDTQVNGIGFSNIRNRISLYGGELKIETAPGKGCAIYIDLHL